MEDFTVPINLCDQADMTLHKKIVYWISISYITGIGKKTLALTKIMLFCTFKEVFY